MESFSKLPPKFVRIFFVQEQIDGASSSAYLIAFHTANSMKSFNKREELMV